MNREEVKQKVLAIIEDKGYFGDTPTEETTCEDLGYDSMDYAELQVLIENEFFISPKEAEWDNARTVAQWVDVAMKHIKVD